jgi:ribose 5-phosphate isomerase B
VHDRQVPLTNSTQGLPAASADDLGQRKDIIMPANNRIVLSSDHAAIAFRQTLAAHIAALGWEVVDIGPTTPESTHYPIHGRAAAQRVASGDCRFGIILCGTGQGIMMAANKVSGIRCGVCHDTFSARMIRQHNDANMLSLGVRVIGEGLALDVVDAFLNAEFEGGRHGTRVDMIEPQDA